MSLVFCVKSCPSPEVYYKYNDAGLAGAYQLIKEWHRETVYKSHENPEQESIILFSPRI